MRWGPWPNCVLLLLLLLHLAPSATTLGLGLSAKSAFFGFSYIMSFLRTAERLFALLSPTTGVITVLRGRRAVGIEYQNLRYDFLSATLHDPMQCLPLVLCAIHADPDDLITAKEAAFRKTFRPYFTQQPIPDWAEQYVHAADIGATTKSTDSCREAYPFCGFSQYYLRKLITQAMNSEGRSLLQTYK
ncbi:uncharacterized protein LOC121876546 isoform X2 [Homarus americanus]|uniref:uncharacterized protein LOC121876546 isoform X2 n=1 Tax=Homarus americanus TaxID=6706 RepID=UPI001C45A6E8|nr:uncharacterized protein LOC121876546 isoform X2 [Homarus americanus]